MNTELEAFLKEVTKHVTVKEPTLFAVGGRGHYENPATDLLKFFLKPKAEHRLGDLFLSTYLECMKKDPSRFNMDISNDKIESQVKTKDGSYIDLQILGPDWCLIIENKIRHSEVNPFVKYENHAEGLPVKKKLFSVLSPSGFVKKEGKTKDWKGVSYLDYFKALRQKMPGIDSYNPLSKWQIFAREFILHLENELYDPPMKDPDQIKFVEEHANQIAEAEKLAKQYRKLIYQELKLLLGKSVPGNITIREDTTWVGYWLVFRCASSQWGNSQIVLYRPEGAGKKFEIRVYLENMSEQQLSDARRALAHMKESVNGYWDLPTDYDSSEKAIPKLCEQAKIVNNLFNNSDSTP